MTSPQNNGSASGEHDAIPFQEIHEWYRTQLADAMERIAFMEITLRKKNAELDKFRQGGEG